MFGRIHGDSYIVFQINGARRLVVILCPNGQRKVNVNGGEMGHLPVSCNSEVPCLEEHNIDVAMTCVGLSKKAYKASLLLWLTWM